MSHILAAALRSSPVTQNVVPFQFVAASHLIRIRTERAWTLAEMASHLRSVPAASIFYHTFQTLEAHHYTSYSNDFAQWVTAACNETVLGERLGAIDVRDFVSLDDLRKVLVETLEDHLSKVPQSADRPGFEPFYFCESIEVTLPLGKTAASLEELASGIEGLSLQSLHFHFISSRIRLQLHTNDFSHWIVENLGLTRLAKQLDRVDFYTYTLEGVRTEIVNTIRASIR